MLWLCLAESEGPKTLWLGFFKFNLDELCIDLLRAMLLFVMLRF